MPKGQLSGPCSLCGSKRSTSCWRPLPEYTGSRAGQPTCNACYVSVAKQAREDVTGVPRALEARCALQGSPARIRKRRSTSKAPRSASPAEQLLAEPPSQGAGLAALLALLSAGQAELAAGTPPSSPVAGQRSPSVEDSTSQAPHARGSKSPAAAVRGSPAAPLRRSVRRQQQQQQQGGMLSPGAQAAWPEPVLVHSPALSSAPPAAMPVAGSAGPDQPIQMMQRACARLAGSTADAAEHALHTVRSTTGNGTTLVAMLPALQLLLPGTGRVPLPAGALLVVVQHRLYGNALHLASYCPQTGQVLRCRAGLRQEEAKLYMHPRRRVPTWDSSDGWKLLFPELSEDETQMCLFQAAVARFGAVGQAIIPQPAPMAGLAAVSQLGTDFEVLSPQQQQQCHPLAAFAQQQQQYYQQQQQQQLQSYQQQQLQSYQRQQQQQQAWQMALPEPAQQLQAQTNKMQQWVLSPPQQQQAWQLASPEPAQPQHAHPTPLPPQWALPPIQLPPREQHCPLQPEQLLPWEAASSRAQLPQMHSLAPPQGCLATAGQQPRAQHAWEGSAWQQQAEPPVPQVPSLEPVRQLQQQVSMSEVMALPPAQPQPEMPLPWMPLSSPPPLAAQQAQQAQQAPLGPEDAPHWWDIVGASLTGEATASLGTPHTASLGSPGQPEAPASGGHMPADAAPGAGDAALPPEADESLLNELGLDGWGEAGFLEGLDEGDLDSLLSFVFDREVAGA